MTGGFRVRDVRFIGKMKAFCCRQIESSTLSTVLKLFYVYYIVCILAGVCGWFFETDRTYLGVSPCSEFDAHFLCHNSYPTPLQHGFNHIGIGTWKMQSTIGQVTPIHLVAMFNLQLVQDEQILGFLTPDFCSEGLLWIFRISSWVFFHLAVVALAILVSPSTAFWGKTGGARGFSDALVVHIMAI